MYVRCIKTLYFLVGVLLITGLFPGCSLKIKNSCFKTNESKIKILCTTRMIRDLVDEIGGDFIDALSLINGELDPHSYELVKGDDEKFYLADLVICNGLGLEYSHSLRKNLENKEKVLFLGNKILENYPDLIIKVNGQLDPHIWLDIFLWSHGVEFIQKALVNLDPEHKDYYEERSRQLVQKMLSLDNWAKDFLQKIPCHKRYLVSGHNSFNYFVKRYFACSEKQDILWKERYFSPEGLAPEAQISSRDIIETVNFIEKFNIGVVFLESNLNGNVLKRVVKACKNNKVRLSDKPLCGDSLGKNASYFDMFRHNVELIQQELIKDE